MGASPDMEAAKAAPVKPVKPSKPPSPHVPRAFAVVAILCLLAIPIAVPIVVMKVTGTTGKKYVDLSAAITGPELTGLQPTAAEEVSPEEIKESFLKVNDKTVRSTGVTRMAQQSLHSRTVVLPAPNDHLVWRFGSKPCWIGQPLCCICCYTALTASLPPVTSCTSLPVTFMSWLMLLLTLQFERFCRPYYTAGFNAYELVEAAMVSRRAETVGAFFDQLTGRQAGSASMQQHTCHGSSVVRNGIHLQNSSIDSCCT